MSGRHISSAHPALLALGLIVCLSACQKWVALEPPFPAAIAEQQPGTVRATLTEYSVVIDRPSVNRDTLTGWHYAAGDRSQPPSVRLPVSTIESLEARRANTAGTVGIVLGVAAVAAAAVLVRMGIAMNEPGY